jgi:hypothetical protein
VSAQCVGEYHAAAKIAEPDGVCPGVDLAGIIRLVQFAAPGFTEADRTSLRKKLRNSFGLVHITKWPAPGTISNFFAGAWIFEM